jgi:type II secretory ATPase GspE/PulE/Tfp pilus assembly ATPase PilB-like protein/nucleotide-binding universal stress UspA family protein
MKYPMLEFKRILAATDFSEYSQPAVEWAAGLAVKSNAELHLLHVIPEPALLSSPPTAPLDELARARQQLEQLLPPEQVLKLVIVRSAVHGSPAVQIVQYAEQHGIDLIVMGTHGRTGLVNALRGSVAEKVRHVSRCPVVIVPLNRQGREFAGESSHGPIVFEPAADLGGATPAHDLLNRALAVRASDLHIDPLGESEYEVRFRIDGRLQSYCRLERDLAERLIHQFKLLANLDLNEPFAPQEGRLRLTTAESELQVRLTSAPVAGGEAVALRLLPRDAIFRPLSELGFSFSALAAVERMLHRKQGLVLISGPSGAGKTTTAYCMLQALATGERNIVSIEDPVEYSTSFIRQMRVDERHGVTLNSGLRTLLRMDPDVLLVGEILDRDTAEIVMRASSAGRYVVSTMHARDVAASLMSLQLLHANASSIVTNLVGVICQRLVRRICPHCKQTGAANEEQQRSFHEEGVEPPRELCHPRGCEHCGGTGYRGRVGVFEAAVIEGDLAVAVMQEAPPDDVRRLLRSSGVCSMMGDALLKAREGVTSVEEAQSLGWI